jgi:hypothetical protein
MQQWLKFIKEQYNEYIILTTKRTKIYKYTEKHLYICMTWKLEREKERNITELIKQLDTGACKVMHVYIIAESYQRA